MGQNAASSGIAMLRLRDEIPALVGASRSAIRPVSFELGKRQRVAIRVLVNRLLPGQCREGLGGWLQCLVC